MISGRRAFAAPSREELLEAVMVRDPAPFGTERPDLPPGLEPAVRRAMAKDPGERFATAGAFAEAVERAVRQAAETGASREDRPAAVEAADDPTLPPLREETSPTLAPPRHAAAPASGMIGQVLHDTYRLERLLGTGGMGMVYEASHRRLARRFAVKVLAVAHAADPEAMERFKREAMTTSRLGHPHIVEVIDFHQTPEGTSYLVMELLEGEDLATRLRRPPRVELHELGWIVSQTASALQAAHNRGIVHRDLKPQNIFLCKAEDRPDFVKVIDFGVSKVLGVEGSMTSTGAVVGTPFYMAPEQADRRTTEVVPATDVYALGSPARAPGPVSTGRSFATSAMRRSCARPRGKPHSRSATASSSNSSRSSSRNAPGSP